ncbi:MAG: hypothetical protein HYZ73_02750 [Elusimicrobia bacterium]|nr:hypothetical protein [Elusimicrobiota bacterium]
MTLTDFVRDASRESTGTLQAVRGRIASLYSDKIGCEQRLAGVREDTAQAKSRRSANVEIINGLKIEEAGLLKEIGRLKFLLSEKQKEIERAKSDLDAKEAEVTGQRRSEQTELKVMEKLDRRISQAEEEVTRLTRRISDARLSGLAGYLDGVWNKIFSIDISLEKMREKNRAYEEFLVARHEDPGIADLIESLEEWKQILETAAPKGVRETAQLQINDITRRLNEKFPGALEVSEKDSVVTELEELHYFSPDGESTVIFLPVPVRLWHQVSGGQPNKEGERAVRMIWEFINSYKLSPENASFILFKDRYCGLRLSQVDEDLMRDPITVKICPGGEISFVLSEVPTELVEDLKS